MVPVGMDHAGTGRTSVRGRTGRLVDGTSTAATPPDGGPADDGERVKPAGPTAERSPDPASTAPTPHPARVDALWERLLSRENLARALRRVEANRGAPGPDGMTTGELRPYLKTAWPALRAALDAGTYRPSPVRRVTIPSPAAVSVSSGCPRSRTASSSGC